VTATGGVNLSSGIPRTLPEVENWVTSTLASLH
jgi:hypothetical protein